MSAMDRLFKELGNPHVNLLSIRNICKSNPSLLNQSVGENSTVDGPFVLDQHTLRVRVWTLLLLGPQYTTQGRVLLRTKIHCEEHGVLLADIKRTRQELVTFRTPSYSDALLEVLNCFCVEHAIQYKQGMNEVCSVFIHCIPPTSEEAIVWIYDLFSSFMYRFMERYCCLDSITYLQKSFQLFQVLLQYHDPILGNHLSDGGLTPDMYSPEWFLTLFARSCASIDLLAYLWDALVCGGDPVLVYFLGFAMLHLEAEPITENAAGVDGTAVDEDQATMMPWSRRQELLDCDGPQLIEAMSGKQLGLGATIGSFATIDQLVRTAQAACELTPRCFARCLRLSCVASATTGGGVGGGQSLVFTGGSKNGTGTTELSLPLHAPLSLSESRSVLNPTDADADVICSHDDDATRPIQTTAPISVKATPVDRNSSVTASAVSTSVVIATSLSTDMSASQTGSKASFIPKPNDQQKAQRRFAQTYLSRQDESMTKQSYLDFVSMEPQELISYVLESVPESGTSAGADDSEDIDAGDYAAAVCDITDSACGSDCLNAGLSRGTSSSATSHVLSRQQHVIIDLRSPEDVSACGGVLIPKAIQLDPACVDFLDPELVRRGEEGEKEGLFVSSNPISSLLDEDEDEDGFVETAANTDSCQRENKSKSKSNSGKGKDKKPDSSNFYRWIQHYDSMKDCHICIVDTPLPISGPIDLASIAALGFEGIRADVSSLTAAITSQLTSYDYGSLLSNAANVSRAGVKYLTSKKVRGVVKGALSSAQATVASATGTIPDDFDDADGRHMDSNICDDDGGVVSDAVMERSPVKESDGSADADNTVTGTDITVTAATAAPTSLASYWSSIQGLGSQFSSLVGPEVFSQLAVLPNVSSAAATTDRDNSSSYSSSSGSIGGNGKASAMAKKIVYNADYLHRKIASGRQYSKASVALAKELQRHGFKYVSILNGGLPALLQQCYTRRGDVEPLMINFKYDKWEQYLKQSHLQQFSCNSEVAEDVSAVLTSGGDIPDDGSGSNSADSNSYNNKSKQSLPGRSKLYMHDPGARTVRNKEAGIAADGKYYQDQQQQQIEEEEQVGDVPEVPDVPIIIRYSAQLTPIERVKIGLEYATRHGHTGMMAQLSVRLRMLQDEDINM